MVTANTDQDSRSGRRLKRLLITLGVLLGCLVVAEIVVRWAVKPGRLMRMTQLDAALAGTQRHQFLGTIQDDSETFWRFAPDVVLPPGNGPFFGRISNSQGLRENAEIPIPKPAGEVRILFLGDSCTFGYLLDESHSYVALLEAKLRQRFPRRKIECINGGVPGYTAYQCWRKLLTEGFDYEPDLVVMQFGWNERIIWDGRSDPEHYRALQRCQPPGILGASRLCQQLWTWARWPEPSDDGRSRLSQEEFRRVLSRIGTAVDEKKVDFLLLLTGCRQNVRDGSLTTLQGEQLQFAKSRRFGPKQEPAFVNGVTRFTELTINQRHPVETYLFDEAHPTRAYNEILSDEMVRTIGAWLAAR